LKKLEIYGCQKFSTKESSPQSDMKIGSKKCDNNVNFYKSTHNTENGKVEQDSHHKKNLDNFNNFHFLTPF